jgi:hypothetical protein
MMGFENFGFGADYSLDQPRDARAEMIFQRPVKSTANAKLIYNSSPADCARNMVAVSTNNGERWTGAFESGPGKLTGYFATPNPDVLCAVVEGQGYWIPVHNPHGFEVIDSVPIQQVARVPERDILLFVDFVRITAYGPMGLLWQTKDVSWDGISITEVSARQIRGMGWDAPRDCAVEFTVSVDNGSADGGASPPNCF